MTELSPIGPVATALRERPKVAIVDGGLARSAVLVPLFVEDGELGAVFLRRSALVEHHKREYCFPGGHVEPQDESLSATALRECAEEVGLAPGDVQILGELDDVRTAHAVKITPFVGAFPFPYRFVANPAEVEAIVPLRLSRLLAPGVRTVETWNRPDSFSAEPRYVTFYRVDQHVIWGATARILDQLLHAIGRLP